ncbi:MAG: prolipoprotein diacylglyceryl transferase [Oscillospiraceae bacterium]|nr:prolipoprotein diacylglyceryl transferase [Oscillospiraceae bacterium]
MLPTITVRTLHLSTYWLMFAMGVCAMGVLMVRRRKQYDLSVPKALLFTLLVTVFGVTGTKLLYILESWPKFTEDGLTLGGQSFFGAVFLVPALMAVFGRLFALTPGRALDACAPCGAVIVACMRFGCFMNGCCGGWEMTLGNFRFLWPTQAIESMGDFVILGLLLRMEERGTYPGRRYAVFLAAYGVLRFFVEFLRDTAKDWLYLSHGQWFAILGCLIGGASLWWESKGRSSAGQNCNLT